MWIFKWKNAGHEAEAENKGKEEYIKHFGKHFNRKLQEFAARHLKNADGSEHRFTEADLPTTINVRHPHDLLYTANWLYSDLYPETLKTTQAVWQEALRQQNDPDGYEGMPFCRWCTDMCQRKIEVPWHQMHAD